MGSHPLKMEEEQTERTVKRQCIERRSKKLYLPPDIITNVLSRIPGSSLVTFRTVCKLWRSLTCDHRLVELHLLHASRRNPPRFITFSEGDQQGQRKYHLTLVDESWNIKYRLTRDSDGILSTPPCNGLVCLYDYSLSIKLCNPTTQEFLDLPKPTVNRRGIANAFPKCSLGYCPSTKQHKVVRFFYRQMNHKTETYDLGCEVFTLGTDQWRYIGNIDSYVTGSGTNVDGCLYWTTGAIEHIPDMIIALDLKDEKFRVVIPPDVASYDVEVNGDMFLVQLEGSLCLVNAPYGGPGSMDIWMLQDYASNVWIHRCHVPLQIHLRDYRWRPEPLVISGGKILVRWGTNLYYYDLEAEQGTMKEVHNDGFLSNAAKIYLFFESLIPLNLNRL